MTTTPHTDDPLTSEDALDRVIDEAVGWTLASTPVNLRSRVLERIDALEAERTKPPRRAMVSFLLRPALLPVAGAALIVAAVAGTWWRVDQQLGPSSPGPRANHAASARGRATSALRASVPGDAGATSRPVSVPGGGSQPAEAQHGGLARAPEAPANAPRAAARRGLAGSDTRIAAASWLVVVGDESEPPPPEHAFPGAPAGDLGEPIALMPRPRPITIPPITTPPISDAPPVSTLAQPVSTLTAEDVSRDQQDPGKSGGFRR